MPMGVTLWNAWSLSVLVARLLWGFGLAIITFNRDDYQTGNERPDSAANSLKVEAAQGLRRGSPQQPFTHARGPRLRANLTTGQ